MPKPNRYTALLAAISLIFIVFIGCRKEESGNLSSKEEEQASMATAVSETETEFAFNDVFDNVVGKHALLVWIVSLQVHCKNNDMVGNSAEVDPPGLVKAFVAP